MIRRYFPLYFAAFFPHVAFMKKLFFLFFLSFFPLSHAQASEGAVTQAHLSVQDKNDLARIEAYLNGMKNISADFLQIDDAGGIMRGDL